MQKCSEVKTLEGDWITKGYNLINGLILLWIHNSMGYWEVVETLNGKVWLKEAGLGVVSLKDIFCLQPLPLALFFYLLPHGGQLCFTMYSLL
jgi:hypothetical protein